MESFTDNNPKVIDDKNEGSEGSIDSETFDQLS
jgi:hypothetical protein